MGCHFLLQGIFPTPRDGIHFSYVSCIGTWVVYQVAPPGKPFVGLVGLQLELRVFSACKGSSWEFSFKLKNDIIRLIQADLLLLHFAFLCAFQMLSVLQVEGLWQTCGEQVSWHHFSDSVCYFLTLSHILVILEIFQTFSLLLHLLWWPVIFDFTLQKD